jgi:hypothetical protein
MESSGDGVMATISADPLEQVGRVLRRLLARTEAKVAVVLYPDRGRTRVIPAADTAFEQKARELWQSKRAGLAAGHHYTGDGFELAPLIESRWLIGALYLEGVRRDSGSIPDYMGVLTRALREATTPLLVFYDGSGSTGRQKNLRQNAMALWRVRLRIALLSFGARLLGLPQSTQPSRP